ncbi:MAG: hypothetical protein ACOCUH_02335 [Bacteriovoracia bacterium]
MAMKKVKEKIDFDVIEMSGKKYVLASQVSDYAKSFFETPFDIPSYRTIRYYVTNGIIKRPHKLGRKTYFEEKYILSVIKLLKSLSKWHLLTFQLKKIVLNVVYHNQVNETVRMLDKVYDSPWMTLGRREEIFNQLSTKEPKKVNISKIMEKNYSTKYPFIQGE